MTRATYLDGRSKYSRPQAMLWSDNNGEFSVSAKVSGLVATISTGTNTVTLTTGATTNLKVGYRLTKVSGTGQFNGNPIYITEITNSTTFKVGSNTGTALNHLTAGSITFTAGLEMFTPVGAEQGEYSSSAKTFMILSDHNRANLDFKINRIEKRERTINGRMRSYHIADKLTISTSWQRLPSRSGATSPNFDSSTGLTTKDMYTVDGGAGGNELLNWYETHTGPFYVFLAYDKYTEFGNNDTSYGHMAEYNQVVEMYISDFSYSVEKRGAHNMDLWNINVTLEEV